MKEKPKPPPINAKAETVAKLPMFRDAYKRRRCILPIDAFFEWKAILGQKAKQPFAIAMADRSPFGLAGLWENWKDPSTGEWTRTFAVLTTTANELVAEIHDRMPVILPPDAYDRWLGLEPDPRDLLKPFPAELMTMWPVSTRVNAPKNDDEDLIRPVRLPDEAEQAADVVGANDPDADRKPVNSECPARSWLAQPLADDGGPISSAGGSWCFSGDRPRNVKIVNAAMTIATS